MVFRPKFSLDGQPVNDQIFIVVANLKWGLLVWPLRRLDNGTLQFVRPGGLEWYFTTRCDQHDASDAVPVLTDVGISAAATQWEPSVKALLRNFSLGLTFGDLCLVATFLGIQSPKNLSRANLVNQLALQVGDQDFAEHVRSSEDSGKKRKAKSGTDGECHDDGFDSDDSLAELLLDNMDAAELDDFKELKKRVNERHTVNKKRKWAQWKKDDQEVIWQHVFLLNFPCVLFGY